MGSDEAAKRRASLSRILNLAQSPQTHPAVLSQVRFEFRVSGFGFRV